jgi:hypothetical protein
LLFSLSSLSPRSIIFSDVKFNCSINFSWVLVAASIDWIAKSFNLSFIQHLLRI